MDHKTNGPYKHYERPSKGRAEGMKPTQNDRGWKIGVWLFAIILIVLLPVTYQLSAKNIHPAEQAIEVQRVSKPVKHKKVKKSLKSSTDKQNQQIHNKASHRKAHKQVNNSQKTSPSSTNANQVKTYVVQSGDTMTEIAAKHGMTVAELEKLNGLSNSDSINAGQTLRLN